MLEAIMSEQNGGNLWNDTSRRQFMKGASALVAGGALLGVNQQIARSAHVSGSDEIKIGLVGCGGRGRAAAMQALETKGKVTLWSVCDAFADNMTDSLDAIRDTVAKRSKDKESLF